KLAHGRIAAVAAEVALDNQPLIDFASALAQRFEIPGAAVDAGGGVKRPGDGGDPLVAQADQVAGRQIRARDVVHVYVAGLRGVRRAANVDRRDLPGDDLRDQRVDQLLGRDDHAVEQAGPQRALVNSILVVLRVEQEQRQGEVIDIARARDAFNQHWIVRVGKDELGNARDDQADDSGAARGEGAGGEVRLIARLRDDLLDAHAILRRHAGGVVHHARNRRAGHSSETGD